MTEAGGISPPLAEVLARAARVWQAFMAGRSLDRALAEVVPDGSRLRQATQDVSYAAVRRRAFSERVIAELAARAPSNGVRALLSVALPQLLTDRHAPYAVVDQAVTAARADQATAFAAGFVNALLRNFLRQQSGIVERLNREDAVLYNAPLSRPDRRRRRGYAGPSAAAAMRRIAVRERRRTGGARPVRR